MLVDTPGNDQGLCLTLVSEIIPGRVKETLCYARDPTWLTVCKVNVSAVL